MAEVSSTFELPQGASAPDFRLPDGAGNLHALTDIAEGRKATVVMFACNHCPYVIHLASAVGAFAREYDLRGVAFVAINANDVERYPQDSPERMVSFAASSGWNFPYLHDSSQETALAYRAACTPDFFVFDSTLRLVWAGQFDNSRPGNQEPVTGADLRRAVDAVLGGDPAEVPQRPSSGCNIKWKPGGEPPWFG